MTVDSHVTIPSTDQALWLLGHRNIPLVNWTAHMTITWTLLHLVTSVNKQKGLKFPNARWRAVSDSFVQRNTGSLIDQDNAEVGVAALQEEVSTDSAWRNDIFVPKGCAESALKAHQLKPGLLWW